MGDRSRVGGVVARRENARGRRDTADHTPPPRSLGDDGALPPIVVHVVDAGLHEGAADERASPARRETRAGFGVDSPAPALARAASSCARTRNRTGEGRVASFCRGASSLGPEERRRNVACAHDSAVGAADARAAEQRRAAGAPPARRRRRPPSRARETSSAVNARDAPAARSSSATGPTAERCSVRTAWPARWWKSRFTTWFAPLCTTTS